MFVKICGLRTRAGVEAAVEAGADAVGFVFADSVREIEPDRARTLCDGLPSAIVRVAVMRHPSRERLEEVLEAFAPDWIQTDAEDLEALAIPPDVRALPVYRDGALPRPASMPERLLFEGLESGSGRRADWDEARRLASDTELVLAGGLSVDNVGDAIEYVRPWGVDVSSGVERNRGNKDPRLIADFVARVRAEERTQ